MRTFPKNVPMKGTSAVRVARKAKLPFGKTAERQPFAFRKISPDSHCLLETIWGDSPESGRLRRDNTYFHFNESLIKQIFSIFEPLTFI